VNEIRAPWQVSIRRACGVIRAGRSSYHYRGRRADLAALKKRIKEIAETSVRYGYRRVHVLLKREGWAVNSERIHRLYKEQGLHLRHKSPRWRVKAKLRQGRAEAVRANEVWAMNFVHDQLATGPKLRILTVVDIFSRFSPAVVPRFRFRAADMVDVLERICCEGVYPAVIRVDQGSEFVSRDLDLWAYAKGVTLDFSRPGKPTDNAFIESFNGKVRAECMRS
jgi:putative transposase